MTQGERLHLLINSLLQTYNSFARKAGINSTATLYRIRDGSLEMSVKIQELIKKAYPNVNMNWLINGTGEMFLDAENQSPDVKNHSNCDLCKEKDYIIEQLKSVIHNQNILIDKLKR